MPDVEPILDDELGDVRRLIDLAEEAADGMEMNNCPNPVLSQKIRQVAERLKGRL